MTPHLRNDRPIPRSPSLVDLLLFRGIWSNKPAGLVAAFGIFAVLWCPILVLGLIVYTVLERLIAG